MTAGRLEGLLVEHRCALRAAGKTAEAADAGRRFKEAWKYADVSLETRQ